jgi:membrane-bound lytic murein transglycosylase A
MQRIRSWLEANPARRSEILNRNPSYVFFRIMQGEAEGAQGVALTPERSLAVDPRYVPLGSPVWLEAEHPAGGQMRRLLVAQDTGGAIKGVVRGDVYWGYGVQAAEWAGVMQSRGRYWLFLPKGMRPDGQR